MTAEEIKKLDMKFSEIVNTGNLAAIDKYIDETFPPVWVLHNVSYPELPHDREGSKKWFHQLFENMPDFRINIENVIAEDDKVAMNGILTGTNAKTKLPFNMHFFHISRYSGGKIVEEWELDFEIPVPAAITP